jgi:enoyl-CoA hydratase/carnithine racemase
METIIDNSFFSASKDSPVAVVKFRKDIFDLISNIDDSQVLTDFIKETEYDKSIKGLLFLNEPGCLGDEAYDDFLSKIISKKADDSADVDVTLFSEKDIRFRKINILNKFVKFLANYKKLYVAGLSCCIVTPFIGVILVADLRFATTNARFSFAHNKYGLHPSGGLPFFLDHYVGHSRAVDLMLSDELRAEDAFQLGLINRILPVENFDKQCIDLTKKYLDVPSATLRSTKRLINFNNSFLEEYFEFESSLLNL